ncbi:hypothetical protein J1614_006575 [Plenodomus biglobosus]|nr:hypothetical protein J1614_006575 [Plenodomus biglobosus]
MLHNHSRYSRFARDERNTIDIHHHQNINTTISSSQPRFATLSRTSSPPSLLHQFAMLHTMSTTASHHHLTAATSDSPMTALLALQTHWHTTKRSSPPLKRLGMRSVEVVALAAAMLVVPWMVHSIMLCFSEMYEFLGRRATSPYSTNSWASVLIALVLMIGWVGVLGRLCYSVDLEEKGKTTQRSTGVVGEKEQRGVSWGRILGRIVIPLLLIVLTGHFALEFARRVSNPMPIITANIVTTSLEAEAISL